MIKIYLYLIDILVPLFFGLITILINTSQYSISYDIQLYFLFSISIFFLSVLKNYYKDYYLINFSEKLRIAFITWVFAVFIQMIAYNYLLIKVEPLTMIFWVLIPITSLFIKFILKIKTKNIMKSNIHIIGKFYTFNDYEIKTLTDKGYLFYLYDSFEEFLSKKITNYESVIVLNLSTLDSSVIKDIKFAMLEKSFINLDVFFEKYLRKIYISSQINVLNITRYDRYHYFIKRIIDSISIILLVPLLILIMIYFYSLKKFRNISESLFYKQKRYGLNNSIFEIYKFRTMHADSDLSGNTIQNDPRIYSFAKLIRNMRLDEIPQIINILFNEMHLVGPRAEWVKLSDEYNKKINHYSIRHNVRPGITGWAQIAYPYGVDTYDAEQKLMYDLYYIKNWTIWLELEICFKTFSVILDKKGF
jgi:lipopolysaccharide/colanic/teichoic acid biosynthesis glycosyltransferase